jgi:hypothetical protein
MLPVLHYVGADAVFQKIDPKSLSSLLPDLLAIGYY